MRSDMSGLMIKRLHKRYGEHVAIEEVSLAIIGLRKIDDAQLHCRP